MSTFYTFITDFRGDEIYILHRSCWTVSLKNCNASEKSLSCLFNLYLWFCFGLEDWVALGAVECGFTPVQGKDDVRSLVAMTTKEGQ